MSISISAAYMRMCPGSKRSSLPCIVVRVSSFHDKISVVD